MKISFSKINGITLKDGKEFYEVGLSLDILEDKSKTLTIKDVNSPEHSKNFKKSEYKIPNYGYSKSAYWFRLRIENHSAQKDWFLAFNVFYQNHIEFYKQKIDGSWFKGVLGDKYPFSQRFKKVRPFVFPISIKKNIDIFIRVISDDGAGEVNLTLLTPSKMAEKESETNLYWGLYFGLFLSMIAYNLFIFISTKSISFFYYVCYCLSGALYMAFFQGYSAAYIFKESPWILAIGNAISMALIGMSLNLFAFTYLGLKRNLSKLSIYYYFLISMHFLALVFSIENTRYYSLIISNIFIPITFVSGIVLAIKKMREGYRPAKYYLIAFFIFMFGAIIWSAMTAGLLPTNNFNNNSPIFAQALQMILLSMGLADRFNYEIEMASIKEKTLQNQIIDQEKQITDTLETSLKMERKHSKELNEMNNNLDIKVKERTSELNDALNSISSLLNNMRQSVFTVGQDQIIKKPVSGFSKNIFGEDITGKTIFDTIFRSIDKESEMYSQIIFSFNIMFGYDELQWLMFKDLYPTSLKYFPRKNITNEKILKINYSPLLDDQGILKDLMFVVEDVTDLLKLENEMAKQKQEEIKNLEILQELASNKKEDLASFFKDASESEQDILNHLKDLRLNFEKGELKSDLTDLFRGLHTLKGNARIYNLSKISQKIHLLENIIEEIFKKENNDIIFKIEKINELIQGTYELQGITNRYLKSAKGVFSIDFGEGLKLKESLHDLIKLLEVNLRILENDQPLIIDLKPDKAKFFPLKFVLKRPFFNQFLKNWEEITHSLKGTSRAMDEENLSQKVHKLESAIFNFERAITEQNSNFEKLELELFESYLEVKESASQIYIQSLLFEPKNIQTGDSLEVFFSVFQFTEIFLLKDFNNPDQLDNIINDIISLARDLSMDYVQSMALAIKDSLKKSGKENLIQQDLFKIWQFFYILLSLDNNEMAKESRRKFSTLINQTAEIRKSLIDFSGDTLLEKLFLKISESSPNKDLNHFFDTMEQLQIKTLKDLSPYQLVYEEDLKEDINYIFYKIKQKDYFLHKNNIDEEIKPFFKLITDLCENNMPCAYQAKIDMLKFLRPYTGIDDEKEYSQKPKTTEVLFDNLTSCKQSLSNYFDNPPIGFSLAIEKCFDKLREEPVKYSLSKFKNVVSDISKTLGKTTSFLITGDQSSMSHDKLTILQEAILHLIRNSLDHGLEPPNQRVKMGKKERGIILINIDKKDNETVISLKDDGKGINIDKVVRKALNQGIIFEKDIEFLNENQKIDLIFSPNLSTKEQVSEISGRGIGMDVVKKNIERIGGKIFIKTIFGQSTEFEIIIPD